MIATVPSPATRVGVSQRRRAIRRFAKNRLAVAGGGVIVLLVLVAIFAPVLAPHSPYAQVYTAVLKPPSHTYPLGTDEIGRDVLSRVIYGARVSLLAAIVPVVIALAIALPVGLFAGFAGGFWDEVILMRITDAWLAFPPLILALAIAAVLGPNLTNALLALGISFAPAFIRLIRGQVLQEKAKEYVEASRSIGTSRARTIVRHILPNIASPVLVQASLTMAAGVLGEAGLSFLGLGTQPPTPSWGADLNVAQGYVTTAPWLSYWPGLAIMVVVLAFNLFGDGVRDYLDPRLRS